MSIVEDTICELLQGYFEFSMHSEIPNPAFCQGFPNLQLHVHSMKGNSMCKMMDLKVQVIQYMQ